MDKLGLTAKSKKRSRRPTLAELDKLMVYFETIQKEPVRNFVCEA